MNYQILGIYEYWWSKWIVGMIKRDILEEIIVKKVIETQQGREDDMKVVIKEICFGQ